MSKSNFLLPLKDQVWGDDAIPLVSISCITFNHAAYIRECLDGFLMQQTNFPVEILIHDDASTDGTEEIVREYERKYPHIIKALYEEENQWIKGRRGSIIFNFPRAKGKYIAMCEGDDYWVDKQKLQRQVDCLETDSELILVYTDAFYFYESTREMELKKTVSIKSLEELLVRNRIWTLTTCFRASILEGYNLHYYEKLKNFPFGDYTLWLYAYLEGKGKYLPIATSVYRVLGESASHSKDSNRMFYFAKSALEVKMFFLEYVDPVKRKSLLSKIKGELALKTFQISLKNNDFVFFKNKRPEIKLLYNYNLIYYAMFCIANLNFTFGQKVYRLIKGGK